MDINVKDKIKELVALEETIQFDHFDSELALKIGNALIEEARTRKNKIAIDIEIGGRRLFHYSSDGNALKNDLDIERKKNMVKYSSKSSLWNYYMLEDAGKSMWDKWHLDEHDYAAVGGGFPIRLKNCSVVIGVITVSGFNHFTDHQIIIDVLNKIL